MPDKALVVFRVVFVCTLLVLTIPVWGSASNTAEQKVVPASDTTLKITTENSGQPAAKLPTLTLDDVLTRVLQRSPELEIFSQEIKARDLEARQAGLRPNPEVSVEVDNVAGSGNYSGTDNAETTIRISQRVELGGKRNQRKNVGRLDHELAEREYDLARAEVLAEATERFVATLAAQKRLALAGEQVALTRKVLQSIEDRIAAGKTAEIERVRFQTLTAEARLRRDQAARAFSAARLSLATIWGSNEVDFGAVAGQLEHIQDIPDLGGLSAKLADSPEIVRQRSMTRHADQTLALERAKRIPDLTFSMGVKNDQESSDNALLAEVSLPLQLFDRNQHGIAAAQARKVKAANQARSVQLQLLAELSAGWEQLHAAHSEARVLRDEILPASEKSFAAITYGYQSGKFGFLEVLDAERSLFEAKNRYVDTLASYHQVVAKLEQLLGNKIFSQNATTATLSPLSINKRGQL